MFRFAHPEYLYGLFIVPFLAVLYILFMLWRRKQLAAFANKKLHNVLFPFYSNTKSIIKFILVALAIELIVLAAANPQVGTRVEEVKQTGIDVYILLDVSQSMNAEDIKPSRLQKAKYQISNLISRLRGDRIGLIIFAGDAYIQFPLTTDYSAASLFLNAVDVNSVPNQGTAIAAALELANKSFDYKSSTQKAVVIITDGEDHEGDINDAVNKAVSNSIKVYTIGLGSQEGVPIPIYNPSGQQVDFKKDNGGNVVLTKLDEQTLKEIAAQGKGHYYRGSNYEDHLDKIYQELNGLEKSEYGVKKVTDYEDRYYFLLIPALILLIAEFFLTERKSVLYSKLNKRLGIEK